MLEKQKLLLRITGIDFDVEISGLIEACKLDLKMLGIKKEKIEEPDALIERAISIYVKRDFGWDNADYEKLNKAYESLKLHLILSTEYKEEDLYESR